MRRHTHFHHKSTKITKVSKNSETLMAQTHAITRQHRDAYFNRSNHLCDEHRQVWRKQVIVDEWPRRTTLLTGPNIEQVDRINAALKLTWFMVMNSWEEKMRTRLKLCCTRESTRKVTSASYNCTLTCLLIKTLIGPRFSNESVRMFVMFHND